MTTVDCLAPVALAAVDAEVRACFAAYEAALVAGDVPAMDDWFADDAHTVSGAPNRCGTGAAPRHACHRDES